MLTRRQCALPDKMCLPWAWFDWVYIDPPYASGLYEKVIQAAYPAVCKPDGVLICEHAASEPLPEHVGRCARVDTRRYGIRALSLYKGANE